MTIQFHKNPKENGSSPNDKECSFTIIADVPPRMRIWLRHCATTWIVAGSIPYVVTRIFHWLNPSGLTMTLGSTQQITEMSTGDISLGQMRLVRRADDLNTFMCRFSRNTGSPNLRALLFNPPNLEDTLSICRLRTPYAVATNDPLNME
jgi:hypothetical protein